MFETNENNIVHSDNFYIEDLIYIPIGRYNEMLNRPYTVHVAKEGLEILANRLEETKSGKITPSLISGIANSIIQPSQIAYPTDINKNWLSVKRFIFIMKVVIKDAIGVIYKNYVCGYTDYDGITPNGNIDPNLIHHVNNIIETFKTVINNGVVYKEIEKLSYIYNVISNNNESSLFLQRPTDVFDVIQATNISNILGNNIEVYDTNNTISPFSSLPKTSKVENNITTEYLSEILNVGLMYKKENDFISSLDILNLGNDSISNRRYEKGIHENRFMMLIKAIEGRRIVNEKFIFKSLAAINPDIYNRFKLINITKDYVDPLLNQTPEVGDYWHYQDQVTIKAYSLIENTVSLALRYGFSKIYFNASNISDPTGNPNVFIFNFNSFINLEDKDFVFLLEIFKERFIKDIFINETFENKISIHCDFYIDILGSSKINLKYDTYPANWYTIPTFANSLFSPVATVDNKLVTTNCSYLCNTYEAIDQILNRNNMYLPNYLPNYY